VIAGLADYARPADRLSVSQSTALAVTGLESGLPTLTREQSIVMSVSVCVSAS